MKGFKPYEKYKSSGIDWLGEIPDHWQVRKLKYSLNICNGSDYKHIQTDSGYPVIGSGGQFAYASEFMFDGEVVFLGRKGTIDKPLYFKGKFWAVDTMFYAKGKEGNHVKFHYYVSTQIPFKLYSTSTALPSMTQSDLKEHFLAYPSLIEQTAIANFLDYKTTKIDRFIRKKKQLIKLLNEQKAAIINDAVTKGLDANVKMKSTRIEWLGHIPEHWEVRKLKFVINGKLKYGANEPGGDLQSDDPRYIRITDFNKSGLLRDDTFCSLKYELAEPYLLKEGDILFARSGGTVGKTFQFKNFIGKACYAGYLIKAEPNRDIISSDFLYQYTNSGVYNIWKNFIFNKATIENIGADKYCNLSVTVPPLSEQQKIVSHIETETAKLNKAISTIEKEIALVQEYKTALIAEAVTGKIDVRDYVIPVFEEETEMEDEGEEELELVEDGELNED